MSTFPEKLREHLAGDVTTVCTCWRLTRRDGVVLGFTDHDLPLSFDGTIFLPESGLSASEARDTLGFGIDTVDVEGALSSDAISEADIAAGRYDGAEVETFLVNWREVDQRTLLRTASIGKVTLADGRFMAELESPARKLDLPRGRYATRACAAELGDGSCRFDLGQAGFFGKGTVAVASEPQLLTVSGLDGFAAGWFDHGVLTWQSGARAGLEDRIVSHRKQGGKVQLVLWPSEAAAVEAGDAFKLVAGCDKGFATCKAKFSNTLNFRGFPHLPGNDRAYSYASDGDVFDGGPVVP